jgi:hypothetical protein
LKGVIKGAFDADSRITEGAVEIEDEKSVG